MKVTLSDGMVHDLSAEDMRDILSLADVEVPESEIEKWTHTECTAAINWASAIHVSASDNVLNDYCRAHDEDMDYDPPFPCICRPRRPEFLNDYPACSNRFPLLKRVAS